MRGLNN